jgi:hypothetical protein
MNLSTFPSGFVSAIYDNPETVTAQRDIGYLRCLQPKRQLKRYLQPCLKLLLIGSEQVQLSAFLSKRGADVRYALACRNRAPDSTGFRIHVTGHLKPVESVARLRQAKAYRTSVTTG